MLKTFKYRLYPNKSQTHALEGFLESCRWTYNKTLEVRKEVWENKGVSLSLYDTSELLTGWKNENTELKNAYSQSLQNAQARVDLAFTAFFRRVKNGEKPGYPRFRGIDRYDSFTYPQFGFELFKNRVRLSKIGMVKIRKHRNIEGEIKTLTIRRTSTGKWYACFSCEVEPKPLPKTDKAVGIDVGLESFATLSTGEKIDNPRFFRKAEKSLAKTQRKLSKQKRGTSERKKAKKVVAHTHEKIANKRRDFAHKLSKVIVDKYQVIALEKLNIKEMRENGYKGIRKSIGDVAWNQFVQFTLYKAEDAGRDVALVDPRNTSKMCSRCGVLVEKKLSDRTHSCSCGLVIDRDYNASLNILRLGIQSLEKS